MSEQPQSSIKRHLATADSPNLLVRMAKIQNRDYVTSEDISEALSSFTMANDRASSVIHEDETIKDFLEILSCQVDGMRIEDVSLCASVLWKELELDK